MRSTLCVLLLACGAAPTLADGGAGADAAAPVDDAGADAGVFVDAGPALCNGLPCDKAARVNLSYFFTQTACGQKLICSASGEMSTDAAKAVAAKASAMGCGASTMHAAHGSPDIVELDCLPLCNAATCCDSFPAGAKANACEWSP